jgi:hypothetical protein
MEFFCCNKIILAVLTFLLTETKIIFTHLINHLLSLTFPLTDTKIINKSFTFLQILK